MIRIAAFVLLSIATLVLVSQPAPVPRVGPLADGGFLLNSGWKLEPAGQQVPVDTLPMASQLTPDGKFLFVLNAGYNLPSVSVVDPVTRQELSRTSLPDAWLGLILSPNGKTLYVGGGSTGQVHELNFADGKLTLARSFAVFDKASPKPATAFVGDVALSRDGRLLYAAILHQDAIAVINTQTGFLVSTFKTGRRPYKLLFSPKGDYLLSASWADASLYRHDPNDGAIQARIRVAPHPTGLAWSDRRPTPEDGAEDEKDNPATFERRLFVAAANSNDVHVFGVDGSGAMTPLETINTAMTPRMPLGMTPSAVTLSPDQKTLYVVCSDANVLQVVDISHPRSRPLGYIPTGWYPTGALTLADGTVIVLNGKGLRSFPNPEGPNPTGKGPWQRRGDPTAIQYVGRLQKGSLSFIAPPTDEQLLAYTKRAYSYTPYRDEQLAIAHLDGNNPVPPAVGETTPIEHVIYIVKENRTYDQIFGDVKEGNGDPSLTLFGADVSTNHRKLAKEFVLFDNFYVNSDVSADGHNWSTSAIANDYVAKLWPNSYGGRRKTYDYEGGEPASYPPAGYLWTNASRAGVSMRNYGWWVESVPLDQVKNNQHVKIVKDPVLKPVTAMNYRGFDLDYTDVDRAQTFIADLKKYESEGNFPKLTFLRIGNDHTSGAASGKISPLAAFADNDYALGLIVEAMSHSKFWAKTAIFVIEDDAQNGPDHVDSHRSPAFILSPYTRRGITDSNMYNTVSVLRTIELILGLQPMTQFDASALPMAAAFSATPNLEPYTAVEPKYSRTERNPQKTATAQASNRLDFSEADRADDDELNAILWKTLRPGTPYPSPKRSVFGR